jgi:hypothetical protein
MEEETMSHGQAQKEQLAKELGERADEWHLTPRENLLLRLNARLKGLDVGDAFTAWQNYRKFHARCGICRIGA